MDENTEQLVALGAAVAANWHLGIDIQLAKCDQLIIPSQEVAEAIQIGLAARKDAGRAVENHTHELLNGYPQEAN